MNIQRVFDGMKGASCFSSIDLASGLFIKLEIVEEDNHKSAFRDASVNTMGIQQVWIWPEGYTSRLRSLCWWSCWFDKKEGSPELDG